MSRVLASLTFLVIGIALVAYAWLPTRDSLQLNDGVITRIIPRSNTWHEAEIITSTGVRLTCRGRRGWPVAGPNRCPLEDFERHLGSRVSVLHDGQRPYEVMAGRTMVVDYSAHRTMQVISLVLAMVMVVAAALVLRR